MAVTRFWPYPQGMFWGIGSVLACGPRSNLLGRVLGPFAGTTGGSPASALRAAGSPDSERAMAARRSSNASFTRPASSSFTSLETPVSPSVCAQSRSCFRVACSNSASAAEEGRRASGLCPTIVRIWEASSAFDVMCGGMKVERAQLNRSIPGWGEKVPSNEIRVFPDIPETWEAWRRAATLLQNRHVSTQSDGELEV